MAEGDYTLQELQEMTVPELGKLMDYLHLPYTSKSKKADLVRMIYASILKNGAGVVAPPEPQYSVRILRLKQQNGGK